MDYEEAATHSLLIRAYDGLVTTLSSQRQFTNLTVFIHVTDINDNAPMFSQPQYTVTVQADVAVGTSVAQVHASDRDSGEHGRVQFSLDEVRNNYSLYNFNNYFYKFIIINVLDLRYN